MGTPKTRKMRTRVCDKCGKSENIRADNASSICRSCATRIQNAEKKVGKRNRKHGMTGTTTYDTWRQMMARCYNPNHKSYHAYGGAGVKVCTRWHDFSKFYADMGDKPQGHSIHRIGDAPIYSKETCVYVDWVEHRAWHNKERMYIREHTLNIADK
jgi:hypothetical protein